MIKNLKFNLLFISFFFYIPLKLLPNTNFHTSKSFFTVQPIFRVTSPEVLSIKRDNIAIIENEKRFNFDITPYFGQSYDHKALAKYFLPFEKSTIIAGEFGSTAGQSGTLDVIANYFGVLTAAYPVQGDTIVPTLFNYTFQSELTFEPKQTFFGATLSYRQHLSRYMDRGFWFEIVVPIEHVKNDIGLKEKIIDAGGPNKNDPAVPAGSVGNMTEAFAQSTWKYGKIAGPQSTTGIADAYLKVGLIFVKEIERHLFSYIGLIGPTGNKPTSQFLFEPVVGNNGHFGLFFGTSGGFRIWSECETSIYFAIDTSGTGFAPNTQTRSFDLKDKSFSRYMWVYLDRNSTTTSPGINSFTQLLDVHPGSMRDLNTAYIFKHCGFEWEVGYHFHSRSPEDVKLSRTWQPNVAIASIIASDDTFNFGGTSRNGATINNYLGVKNDLTNTIDGTDTYKTIQESDLNLESAAHPSVVAHTLYTTFSYNWAERRHPIFLGGGGSFDFAPDNAAMLRWMAWFRLGIMF